jgi:hypothetical protein
MIVKVPESKKIYYNKEIALNENNNFMFDEIFDEPDINSAGLEIVASNFYKT